MTCTPLQRDPMAAGCEECFAGAHACANMQAKKQNPKTTRCAEKQPWHPAHFHWPEFPSCSSYRLHGGCRGGGGRTARLSWSKSAIAAGRGKGAGMAWHRKELWAPQGGGWGRAGGSEARRGKEEGGGTPQPPTNGARGLAHRPPPPVKPTAAVAWAAGSATCRRGSPCGSTARRCQQRLRPAK